jgi:hypothetical protein
VGQVVYLASAVAAGTVDANYPAGLKTIVTAPTSTTFTYTEAGTTTAGLNAMVVYATTHASSVETAPNRIYVSKRGKPEAVPLTGYLDVGSRDNAIRKVLQVRDSLFIFKDAEGMFILNGQNERFEAEPFDSTVLILAPDSAVALGNEGYAWTSQGVVRFSDTGIESISGPIDYDLLSDADRASYSSVDESFAVGYETEHRYELHITRTTSVGVYGTGHAYFFFPKTGAWTKGDTTANVRCAIVGSALDVLYCGHHAASALGVYVERKGRSFTDYRDPSDAAISSVVKWAPFTGNDPAELKLWTGLNIHFGNAAIAAATVLFTTELDVSGTTETIDGATTIGQSGSGTPFNLLMDVPQGDRVSERLYAKFSLATASTYYSIHGITALYEPSGDRTSR